MSEHHIAQLNLASMKFAIDSTEMAAFVDRLEDVNALADSSPGFVWRLQSEAGDATGIDYFGSDNLVNMSVWEDIESLKHYVYRSAHTEVLARRKQWFNHFVPASLVLWWIPAGSIPSIEEADDRVENLRINGPNPDAFTFKQMFEPT